MEGSYIREFLKKAGFYFSAVLIGAIIGWPVGVLIGWSLSIFIIWLGVPITLLGIMFLLVLYLFVHESIKNEQI